MADQRMYLSWPLVSIVIFHMVLPIEVRMFECHFAELSDCESFTCRENEVCRLVSLEHSPHAFDVLRSVAPVPHRVEVAEIEASF